MRDRISFFFGLIALLAVALPQGAHAGTPVPQTYSCAAGSFLVGFQGHTGNWIDSFQPICAPWDPVHQMLGPQVVGPAFGNLKGGSPNLSIAVCPSAYGFYNVVYSIEYERTFPNGPPGHLQYLNISCADPIKGLLWGHTYLIGPDDPDKNNSSNEGFDTCPGSGPFTTTSAPLAAYGLVINLDGINIAAVSLECDKRENIEAAAGPAASAPPPVHINAEEAERAHAAFSAPPPTPEEALRTRVALNQPPASAPVSGSWYQSCSNASLYQNVLTASCKSTTGLNVTSSLNLTTCNQPASAANINGMLECESDVASTRHHAFRHRPN